MRFFRVLFLIFLAVPILEIYLLIAVGSQVGAFYTVVLVVGTALLGAALIRSQGLQTIAKIKSCSSRGELPAVPMIEGLLLLIAGALLLTPGFFTDALGFLVVIPILRQQIAKNIVRAGLFRAMNRGGAGFSDSHYYTEPDSDSATKSNHDSPDKRLHSTLEGEFKVEDDK
ncbi:MAG: FxsA family protein [Gammaproteobacteria bacterium]